MADAGETKLHFLTLPPEIRDHIYSILFQPQANRQEIQDEYALYRFDHVLPLLRVNKQIYHEARKIFYSLNTFIRIETPWPEAQHHIALEGHVPILASGERVSQFTNHTMTIGIDAPEVPIQAGDDSGFLIHLDDLDSFTTMWHYSNLTYPDLNPQLRLTITLRSPLTPSYSDPHIPKPIQHRLLLPFSRVKNLHSIHISGNPKPLPSLTTELSTLRAEPLPTPEHCLSTATTLKNQGNAALTVEKNPRRALDLYTESWRAMHVVIKGRKRHIHADQFYNTQLHREPYHDRSRNNGQAYHGQVERLSLRLSLVANTCLAYLKLEDYDECAFWGMRSINLFRDGMRGEMGGFGQGRGGAEAEMRPEEEAMLGFPGADQMGKIYYRTAIAKKMLGERVEARRLIRVAMVYLPRDEVVRAEAAELGV